MTNYNILLIEDDASIRSALSLMLSISGYTVFSVSGGQEALDHIATEGRPQVILLDLMMPDMDGWAFTEAIQSKPEWADIPIFAVSAFSGQRPPPPGLKGVLKKPIDVELLLSSIQVHCPAAVS